MPDEPERVIREVTFAVEGDGRTIEARIVPYGVDTKVVDSPQNGGTGVPYLERWLPGVFDKQTKALDKIKVLLNFEHGRGIGNVVGHAVALREDPDALYGTFRVHPGPDGDKALHMVNEGVLTGLSLEAIPRRTNRTHDGIIERVKATLENVALVRRGAYEDALVLAVREKMTAEDAAAVQEAWTDATQRANAGDPPWEFLKTQTDESVPDPAVEEALQRMGFEKLPRKISRNPWNPSRSRFTDEQWNQSCLVRDLPILEPNGEVNIHAVKAASGRLTLTTGLTSQEKADAARKLVRYYRRADLDIPKSLRDQASR